VFHISIQRKALQTTVIRINRQTVLSQTESASTKMGSKTNENPFTKAIRITQRDKSKRPEDKTLNKSETKFTTATFMKFQL